jgi:DNA-binding NarL/FixJ family response regulator
VASAGGGGSTPGISTPGSGTPPCGDRWLLAGLTALAAGWHLAFGRLGLTEERPGRSLVYLTGLFTIWFALAGVHPDYYSLLLVLYPQVFRFLRLTLAILDGATATAEIAARFPATRVLVLTTYDADADILRAVEAGATGYLLKDTPRERLFPAIRAAARGETVLAPTVATRLVSRMRGRAAAEEALTSREVEVLELVARGASNADIAAALFISEATVKTHLLHTFAKLEVDDRTAAVVAALERGIISRPRRPR